MADLPFGAARSFWQFAEDGSVHHLSSQGIKYDYYEQLHTRCDLDESHLPRDTFKWSSKAYVLDLDLTSTF